MGNTFGAMVRVIDIVDLDEKDSFVKFLKFHGELRHVG